MPLMTSALGGLDLDAYDVVISSEAGPAKWAMPRIEGRHIPSLDATHDLQIGVGLQLALR